VWNPQTKQGRTIFSHCRVSVEPVWGPDGLFAYLGGSGKAESVENIDSSGTSRASIPVAGRARIFWGPDVPLVVRRDGSLQFMDSAGKVLGSLETTWEPVCWSPDQGELLLSQGSSLAILPMGPTGPRGDIKPVGKFPAGPVNGCGWVE
jgi:hypothetical protein